MSLATMAPLRPKQMPSMGPMWLLMSRASLSDWPTTLAGSAFKVQKAKDILEDGSKLPCFIRAHSDP